MSLVSAILFNAPPPVFVGNVRKIIAREMTQRLPTAIQKPRTDKRPGSHELGRMLRANIESLLSDGGQWSAQDVADVLGSSPTSIRRHLNSLVDLGFAENTPGYKRKCNEQLKFWLKSA